MKTLFDEAAALANSDPPLSFDDYCRLEQEISQEFRWYLIGFTCALAQKKGFKSDKLNKHLTRAQVSQNSRYAENSLKQLVRYTKAIKKLQRFSPDLALAILAGKTKLGLKTTIVIARLPTKDIVEIMKRVNTENASARRIIEEHLKRPMYTPRVFADGRDIKNFSKSVKDLPQYDPNAPIAALSYTIPSWIKAINRLSTDGNLYDTSGSARRKLHNELAHLKSVAQMLTEIITEAK